MKKHFYLLAVVFALIIINSTSARADIISGLLGGTGGSSQPANCQPTALPIDNGIVLLVIFAVILGFFAIRRARLLTAQTKA